MHTSFATTCRRINTGLHNFTQAIGEEIAKIESNITQLQAIFTKGMQAQVLKDVEQCALPGPKFDFPGNQVSLPPTDFCLDVR
jgi:hypothetical protein